MRGTFLLSLLFNVLFCYCRLVIAFVDMNMTSASFQDGPVLVDAGVPAEAPPMLRGNADTREPPRGRFPEFPLRGSVALASNDTSAASTPTSHPDQSSAAPCAVRSCRRYYSMSCFVIVGL